MKKKDIIKTIIREFHNWEIPELIKRNTNITLNLGKIISIIGPRRAGKTFFLYQIIQELTNKGIPKENILFINFEDERLEISQSELDIILQGYKKLYPDINMKDVYIFLDEIQCVSGWEKFVRRIYDTTTKNIFITGSNSKLLGNEIATSLRGRTLSYYVYPLSFREFLRFKDFNFNEKLDIFDSNKRAKLINLLNEYLHFGGFPEIVFMQRELKIKTLQEYFNVMIYRDIIERYNVRDSFVLKYFIKRLIENVTKPFSVNKIYNELKSQGIKTSKNTLYKYVEYLENAIVIRRLKKHFKSIVKTEMAEKKAYVIDNGLIKATKVTNNNDLGMLFENMIFNHLNANFDHIVYFKETKECDFVLDEKIAVQVCYDLSNENTKKREIEGLISCCKYFGFKEGYIITFDEEWETESNGLKIFAVPSYKFLLGNVPNFHNSKN